MLSFDITDRHVRIVKGTEANGRIKVSAASTIDLDEGLIVNGHIKDVPKMATLINDELKARKMDDKEAVITISSNLVIFKELVIPKAKTSSQLLTMVTNQMQSTMGIAEDYSISYSIAGEVEEEGVQALKVLATACPFEVVDCFRKVFSMLSIALKSVVVSCNAISRLVLSDRKATAKMPMLVVQVDPNFVSLNLYENNQLSFARFASIDAVDYGGSADYIYEAVNENIMRMVQFQRSRRGSDSIQNVIFYGDTSEYIRLTNSLESLDISTSLMGVPNNIAGYENIEFQAYANAIGAMFKSSKEDRVNLLETDATAGKTEAGGSFFLSVGAAAVVAIIVIAAIWVGLNVAINANEDKIADIEAQIEALQPTIDEVNETQTKINKVNAFLVDAQQAIDNINSWPTYASESLDPVMEIFEEYEISWDSMTYNNGTCEISMYTASSEEGQETVINEVVEAIYGLDMFDNIVYEGWELGSTAVATATDSDDEVYLATISFVLRSEKVEEVETVEEVDE